MSVCAACATVQRVYPHAVHVRLPLPFVNSKPKHLASTVETLLRDYADHIRQDVRAHDCGTTCPLVQLTGGDAQPPIVVDDMSAGLHLLSQLSTEIEKNRTSMMHTPAAITKTTANKTTTTEAMLSVDDVLLLSDASGHQHDDDLTLAATPPNTVVKNTPLAVTRSASDASLSVIATIDENEFEVVNNDDDEHGDNASNYGWSKCTPNASLCVADSADESHLFPDGDDMVSSDTDELQAVKSDSDEMVQSMATVVSAAHRDVLFTEPVTNEAVEPPVDNLLTTDDSTAHLPPAIQPTSAEQPHQPIAQTLETAVNALNNVAVQVGRAVTLSTQRHWRPPPPRNPFKTDGSDKAWVPKSTQTSTGGELSSSSIVRGWTPPAPVTPPTVKDALDDKLSEALARLLLMGFTDVSRNVQVLRACNGDVQRAVAALVGSADD